MYINFLFQAKKKILLMRKKMKSIDTTTSEIDK